MHGFADPRDAQDTKPMWSALCVKPWQQSQTHLDAAVCARIAWRALACPCYAHAMPRAHVEVLASI